MLGLTQNWVKKVRKHYDFANDHLFLEAHFMQQFLSGEMRTSSHCLLKF